MSKTSGQNTPEGYVVISEAVKLSGIARSTFYEYINTGRISVSTINFKGKDRKFVHHSEILRVFGSLSFEQSETNTIKQVETDVSELVRLRTENEGLRALLDEVRNGKMNAEQDKERFAKLLTESIATVKLLEFRVTPIENVKKIGFFTWLKRK
jgi:hypothetical protein